MTLSDSHSCIISFPRVWLKPVDKILFPRLCYTAKGILQMSLMLLISWLHNREIIQLVLTKSHESFTHNKPASYVTEKIVTIREQLPLANLFHFRHVKFQRSIRHPSRNSRRKLNIQVAQEVMQTVEWMGMCCIWRNEEPGQKSGKGHYLKAR